MARLATNSAKRNGLHPHFLRIERDPEAAIQCTGRHKEGPPQIARPNDHLCVGVDKASTGMRVAIVVVVSDRDRKLATTASREDAATPSSGQDPMRSTMKRGKRQRPSIPDAEATRTILPPPASSPQWDDLTSVAATLAPSSGSELLSGAHRALVPSVPRELRQTAAPTHRSGLESGARPIANPFVAADGDKLSERVPESAASGPRMISSFSPDALNAGRLSSSCPPDHAHATPMTPPATSHHDTVPAIEGQGVDASHITEHAPRPSEPVRSTRPDLRWAMQALEATEDREEACSLGADLAVVLAGAQVAIVAIRESNRGELVIRACRGPRARAEVQGARFAETDPVVQAAATTRMPTPSRIARSGDASVVRLARLGARHTAVSIALRGAGRWVGTLELLDVDPEIHRETAFRRAIGRLASALGEQVVSLSAEGAAWVQSSGVICNTCASNPALPHACKRKLA